MTDLNAITGMNVSSFQNVNGIHSKCCNVVTVISPLKGSFSKTVRLRDSWDTQLGNISRIPKPHGFRKTTLLVIAPIHVNFMFCENGGRMVCHHVA